MPQIVYIDISTTATEAPDLLQEMGAIVSVGATTLTAGETQLITSLSDFTAIATSSSGEVANAVTTFYSQGSGPVYILELGAGANIATDLSIWIGNNPKTMYAYLIPDGLITDYPAFATMANQYTARDALTYFFLDCTYAQVSLFANNKAVNANIRAPSADATEVTAAVLFYNWINSNPTSAKQLAPFAFRYAYGVTQWPEKNNSANFANYKAAYLNFIGSGVQGGVSDDLVFWGYFQDGKPMSYWFAVDWCQIHLARDLAYEIIIGSNSTTSPLIYDQRGITRLQARATTTLNTGAQYGCIVGTQSVAAVDFGTYVTQNPSDYPAGVYNGLSATVTPMRGFEQITFYLNVDFSGAAVTSSTTTTGS